MRSHESVPQWNQESLNQLSSPELVTIILEQQKIIEQLSEEIERLRVSGNLALSIPEGESHDQTVQANRSALVDALTGVSNRRGFEQVLQSLDNNPLKKPVSVILFDLDRFKIINDHFGHLIADELLARVGKLLQEQEAGLLSVARLGGDEFAIIAPFDQEQAAALANFIRLELQDISVGEAAITASFGVATNNGDCNMQTTLQTADIAVYAVKEAGGNAVITHERYAEELALKNQDELLVDFENRVRTYTERMLSGLMLRARVLTATLREAAERDALTGLYNRRHLDRVLSREFEKARQTSRELSVALIDLDNFGAINKTFGFTSGDRVLATAANAIAKSIRANDWVARYGGEEFLVVMPDTPLEDAKGVGMRIVTAIRQATAKSYGGDDIRITGTVGISCLIRFDARVEDLIARASEQVKLGKSLGKNQVN